MKSLIGGNPHTVAPTRGFNTKDIEFDNTIFSIYDIGGQKSLREQWGDHFAGTRGVIWVIDSADKRRMYDTGLELANILQDERLSGVPILILANKQDLGTAATAAEISVDLELHSIRRHNWRIQDCSAVNNTGIKEGMQWLVKEICDK